MPSLAGPSCPFAYQLRQRYSTYQQSAKLPKRLAMKASAPLLVCPHERWTAAKVKLLIVGQETLHWRYTPSEVGKLGDPIENFWEFKQAQHGVSAMWDLYHWYALGRAYPNLNSPFWRGFRAIESAIGGTTDAALWTNVFKVNVNGSVLKNCGAAEVSALRQVQRGLLSEEIAILKPDIVVFLSGPRYDSSIQYEFPDLEILPFRRRLPTSAVGVLRAAGLPARTVRTYHPEYLQRSRQLGLLSEISQWATGVEVNQPAGSLRGRDLRGASPGRATRQRGTSPNRRLGQFSKDVASTIA
jgi:hypothetical protein